MKIIVTDGYVENPGDLSWAPLEALGEVTYYDRIGLTDEEAEDCLKCLRDYAARMSRDELGQLSGEALRQYIENLNREKNRRKE